MTHTYSIPIVTLAVVYEMVRESTAQSSAEDWAVRKYLESVNLNKPPTFDSNDEKNNPWLAYGPLGIIFLMFI